MMTSYLKQVLIVSYINLRCLTQRKWLSFSTTFAVMLVVCVLLAFLSLAAGFRHTLSEAGSRDVAVIMRAGSQSEINSFVTLDQVRLLATSPGLAKNDVGQPILSPELFLAVSYKDSADSKTSVTLRGIGDNGLAVRDNISIVGGRMFSPGTQEIIVGRSLITRMPDFKLDQTIDLGHHPWKVVGIFDAGGSVFESEAWADQRIVGNIFKRNSYFQTVRARLVAPESLSALSSFIDTEPRLKLEARSENSYYADQAEPSIQLINRIGWPLALFMAVGALTGVMSTMYSSVEARQRDIATLRAIGFGQLAAFTGVIVEASMLAAVGGVFGIFVMLVLLHGYGISIANGNVSQTIIDLKPDTFILVQGFSLAIAIGVLGGILPALASGKKDVAAAFGR